MRSRTISITIEAYERLRAARRYPAESFSDIVLRARWPEDTITAGELRALARSRGARLSNADLDRIDAMKRLDAPPEDKWAGRRSRDHVPRRLRAREQPLTRPVE